MFCSHVRYVCLYVCMYVCMHVCTKSFLKNHNKFLVCLHTLQVKSSQVKLSFIVIPLHVGTYSGTKCRASQDHGAT